jgi:hypothetical protein
MRVQPTGAPKLQRRTPIFMDEQAKEWRGGGRQSHARANANGRQTRSLNNIDASVLCLYYGAPLSILFWQALSAGSNRDWPPKKPRQESKIHTKTGICPY